ncbi:hypothetical protein HA402_000181 [Bradysia odoriphaga]|nr:hypothetical protein HA402_000181 [Bradysia odoriphaga]
MKITFFFTFVLVFHLCNGFVPPLEWILKMAEMKSTIEKTIKDFQDKASQTVADLTGSKPADDPAGNSTAPTNGTEGAGSGAGQKPEQNFFEYLIDAGTNATKEFAGHAESFFG